MKIQEKRDITRKLKVLEHAKTSGIDFGLEQYDRMAELAVSAKGPVIISVNDIPEMRKAFKGLVMERVEIGYTVGGGEKAKNKSGELIIRNWKP